MYLAGTSLYLIGLALFFIKCCEELHSKNEAVVAKIIMIVMVSVAWPVVSIAAVLWVWFFEEKVRDTTTQ